MLNEGHMWVIGGNTDSSSSDKCLDTATSSEILKSNSTEFEMSVILPEPMVYHCMVKIDENTIFIINGYDPYHEGISRAYVVDISTEPFTFVALPSLKKGRSNAACGIITYENELTIVVAGGGFGPTSRTTEIYKLSNIYEPHKHWESGPLLPRGFSNGCLINSELNDLVMIGGFDEHGKVQPDLIYYNSNSEQFETLPSKLRTPRYGCTAIKMLDSGDCMEKMVLQKYLQVYQHIPYYTRH